MLGCNKSKPIRTGSVGGTSSRVADLGISGRYAVQLVLEECNRKGGINGRRVQLLTKHDQQNPEIARQALRDQMLAILA